MNTVLSVPTTQCKYSLNNYQLSDYKDVIVYKVLGYAVCNQLYNLFTNSIVSLFSLNKINVNNKSTFAKNDVYILPTSIWWLDRHYKISNFCYIQLQPKSIAYQTITVMGKFRIGYLRYYILYTFPPYLISELMYYVEGS